MTILPLREETQSLPDTPRVITLDNDVADEIVEALADATTQTVLSTIYEQPSTPRELRDEIDISRRQVQSHLSTLEEADLIESVDIGNATKDTERTLYVPANEAVVLVAGPDLAHQRLREFVR